MELDSLTGQTAAAPTVSQVASSPLTNVAIFLVITINPGDEHRARVLSLCSDLSALHQAVGFRALDGALSCVMGFASGAWDRLFGLPRPAELHAFQEIRSGPRRAVSTPGDLIFHIRAERMDLCFELASQIMARLSDSVRAADDAVFIGAKDPAFARGSYVIIQKYLHNMEAWNKLLPKPRKESSAAQKFLILTLMSLSNPRRRTMLSPSLKKTARKSKSYATTCPSAVPAVVSSARISSVTAVRLARSNKCLRTCSSGGPSQLRSHPRF
jgi:Dyp-type peroxidase family